MNHHSKINFYEEKISQIEQNEWNESLDRIWLNWIYHFIHFGIKEISRSKDINQINELEKTILELLEEENFPRKEELKEELIRTKRKRIHVILKSLLKELQYSDDCRRCNELYDMIYDYLENKANNQEKDYIQKQLRMISHYKYN